MTASSTRSLDKLDAMLPDRPAGRNIIEHAIDTIHALRVKLADQGDPLRYRHYKGGTYRYITDALLEWAPEHHVIIYESEADGSRWVRPRAEFDGTVSTPDGPVRRFLKINSNDEVIE